MHKTFATPHGGGGPGGGALGVKSHLEPFIPSPVISRKTDKNGSMNYYLDNNRPDTIGRIHGFYGNTAVAVRAYTYIRKLGAEGLRKVAEAAIINANYLRENLKDDYFLQFDTESMHEFVLSGDKQLKHGVRTLDIAKRILDFDMHAPTVYFPLIVHEAMMIEPTETESRQSLDYFIKVMKQIAKEAKETPEVVKSAPATTPVGRLNEAMAAKNLDVCW